MMGGPSVASEDWTVECRLLRESDPRPPRTPTCTEWYWRGQNLHQSRAAPGFVGVGSIRHRSQNFSRRWVGGGRNFLSGAGGEAAGGSPGSATSSSSPLCTRDVEVPQIQFIDRVVDFSVVLQRRVPTVQTVQETGEIPQLQFLDKV